jgi:hypothetical protein
MVMFSLVHAPALNAEQMDEELPAITFEHGQLDTLLPIVQADQRVTAIAPSRSTAIRIRAEGSAVLSRSTAFSQVLPWSALLHTKGIAFKTGVLDSGIVDDEVLRTLTT